MATAFIFMVPGGRDEGKVWCSVARAIRLALPLAALASCSSSETIDQQSKLAASTAQSAVLVTDAWIAGAAPSPYAKAALQSFAETLGECDRQVRSVSSPDAAQPTDLTAGMRRLSEAAGRAGTAVSADERAQAGQARQDLQAAQSRLGEAYAAYFAPQR
ncbi:MULTISPECIES: hypothetical protein [unclassified Mesorhizobium]|uniref:hypothetical protein n=1 Tax=unclassified Mesorhizobium TaxID=325217 RepID=UPI000BB05F1B|nr:MULTISPECIES: hypothetical protein [unclassified Mesorhizobium]PBB84888.1 hypothetical protein CK216_20240 [Mesorhizobium sp. WSM3876]RWE27212.1 MAG: hypothetical protein EOS41_03145 [Mesorhizobium sp.]TGT54350.1 hypothetical protein EN813_042965 [Mesorhizobium sp. M00.F.Ca.ET.170.01.1.1]